LNIRYFQNNILLKLLKYSLIIFNRSK
jgi:hypothetical protein